MRSYGSLHPTERAPSPPDTVNTLLLAAATAQGMDWPTNTQIAVFSGLTTAGAQLNFFANLFSTLANVPSSGSTVSTAGSSGVSHPVIGPQVFQVPSASTGFSVIAQSSGYVHVQCYSKT